MTRVQVLLSLAAVAMIVGLWSAFTAPVDAFQGEPSRLLYLHVPSWAPAFLAFVVTAFGSIIWLIRKDLRWDRLAEGSAEIGILFTGIGLFTGMVWGNAVWGRAWDWGDARLSTTAVMFFVYIGYMALRRATPDPEARARRSAILGIIAVLQVPLVYFAVNMFRTLHQTQSFRPDGASMPDDMRVAILINVAVLTFVYIALLVARIDVAKAEASAAQIQDLAGDAVKPPRLSEVEDV